jgi:hypothetical protein
MKEDDCFYEDAKNVIIDGGNVPAGGKGGVRRGR